METCSISELIACPSGPTIDTVSVKKTKHLELPETWLCVEKNKSPKYMRKQHVELSMKKTKHLKTT